ncbi:MAG: 1-acyl-sn-glycerol-3-phosphate acyltransferase [Hyphomicrobiaceae bacterium]|jgi:1-acyl-sn-glycerol-3-phosphate acyltransferase
MTESKTDAVLREPGRRRFLPLPLLLTAVVLTMTVSAIIMSVAAVLTLFQARRFYAETIGRATGRTLLWLCQVRLIVHRDGLCTDAYSPRRQVVYISNHTSTLDVFALIALGLPNTRFFLSGFLRKFIPLGVIGYLVGNIWTVPYKFPEQRRKIFQAADRLLRRTGESVYLSPEGARITTGEIGKFNKGAFHLATSLQAQIVPMYIAIDKSANPGAGWDVHPGEIHVYFREPIDTAGWRVEDLDANRQAVREVFLAWHEELRTR